MIRAAARSPGTTGRYKSGKRFVKVQHAGVDKLQRRISHEWFGKRRGVEHGVGIDWLTGCDVPYPGRYHFERNSAPVGMTASGLQVRFLHTPTQS